VCSPYPSRFCFKVHEKTGRGPEAYLAEASGRTFGQDIVERCHLARKCADIGMREVDQKRFGGGQVWGKTGTRTPKRGSLNGPPADIYYVIKHDMKARLVSSSALFFSFYRGKGGVPLGRGGATAPLTFGILRSARYCLVAPNYSVWGSESGKAVIMVRVLAVGERPQLGPKALVTLSEMRYKSLLGIVYAAYVEVRTTSYTAKTLY
jgi:hypothetical protein